MSRLTSAEISGCSVTVNACGPRDVFPGAIVVWSCCPRGGYGFKIKIGATVKGVSGSTVLIEFRAPSGEMVVLGVKADSLRWPYVPSED